MSGNDTIAALATAPGESAIAVVRLSGPEAFRIADLVFEGSGPKPSLRKPGTFGHGVIHDGAGRRVDDVLLLVMRAPRSYTGEDVVEIQGHGGAIAPRRVLRACLSAGARPAAPGEFTRRAFLNGKMDLVQAEAVADLIRARSDRAAEAAVEQLEGVLSQGFADFSDELLSMAIEIEAGLDFPEEDLPPVTLRDQHARLCASETRLDRWLQSWAEGRILREGARVVLLGRPNAGKSTLFNALLGHDRAIVTPHPGTTRDTIEEGLVLGGFPIRLIDTAGLREADCPIEQEGVARARRHMPGADVLVHILDASTPPGREDEHLWSNRDTARIVGVLNKTDLGNIAEDSIPKHFTYIPACLSRGYGLDRIREAIQDRLCAGMDRSREAHAVISERHRSILEEVRLDIIAARDLAEDGREDLSVPAAAHLRSALDRMGQLTGRSYQDALLEGIFSRFCIGK